MLFLSFLIIVLSWVSFFGVIGWVLSVCIVSVSEELVNVLFIYLCMSWLRVGCLDMVVV